MISPRVFAVISVAGLKWLVLFIDGMFKQLSDARKTRSPNKDFVTQPDLTAK